MNTNRIYGHQELALLYFPNVLPSSASTQLTRFIRRDPELLSALEAIGYRKVPVVPEVNSRRVSS